MTPQPKPDRCPSFGRGVDGRPNQCANGPGCTGSPCDPTEHCIGWGADRLTYFAEQQTWGTPLLCYDQDMHITHAEQHIAQIISEILRPATTAISSNFPSSPPRSATRSTFSATRSR